MTYLKEKGIQSSIHYPAFWDFSAYKGNFNKQKNPVALKIIPQQLTLPLYPTMTFSEVDKVTNAVLESIK
jgi:dTDP-4-amino-4,6-dideoxygalactose transaminase